MCTLKLHIAQRPKLNKRNLRSSHHHNNKHNNHRPLSLVVASSTQSSSRSIVILPGLGNNASDYTKLSSDLQQRGFQVHTANVRRIDWARNAAGLLDANYWKGTLQPRPTVDWYLDLISRAIEASQSESNGAPITLLAHSAGGWLGRLFMLEYGTAGIQAFCSLGSPHLPPPPGVIDQTRGILTYINQVTPGAFHQQQQQENNTTSSNNVRYTTIAGKYIKGSPLTGPGSWQSRIVGAGYQQVCGECEVWGDGVVPVASAHLEGAKNITLEGCYHSPLGATDNNNNNGNNDSGVVVESESDAENFGLIEKQKNGNDSESNDDDDEVSVFQAASAGPGPRLWYGSTPILQQWIQELY